MQLSSLRIFLFPKLVKKTQSISRCTIFRPEGHHRTLLIIIHIRRKFIQHKTSSEWKFQSSENTTSTQTLAQLFYDRHKLPRYTEQFLWLSIRIIPKCELLLSSSDQYLNHKKSTRISGRLWPLLEGHWLAGIEPNLCSTRLSRHKRNMKNDEINPKMKENAFAHTVSRRANERERGTVIPDSVVRQSYPAATPLFHAK